jgi:hypothetical protein
MFARLAFGRRIRRALSRRQSLLDDLVKNKNAQKEKKKMEEKTVEITVQEYHELLRKVERIAAVERLCARSSYVSIDDVKIILDIEEGENETV